MSEKKSSLAHRNILLDHDMFFDQVFSLTKEGKRVTIPVKGFSMRPFLHNRGDRVVLTAFDKSLLKPYSILFAKDTYGRVVLHRYLKTESHQMLLLRGDGNCGIPERVDMNDVAGVVTHLIRRNRTFSSESSIFIALSLLWKFLFPARSILLRLYSLLEKIKQ